MKKTEKGVMVMLKGKAWGVTYDDGHSRSYGWIEPELAPIHDPKFCKKTTDVTYSESPYTEELMKGRLVEVERVTTINIIKQ